MCFFLAKAVIIHEKYMKKNIYLFTSLHIIVSRVYVAVLLCVRGSYEESNQDTVIVDVAMFYSEFNSTGDQYRKNEKCRCSINRNAKKLVQLMPGY